MNINKNFWDDKYLTEKTGWDIGSVSTPIKEYIDQLKNKNISILIPGAGNSHEAEYFHKLNFKNVTVLDISEFPLNNIKERIPSFPKENLILGDFFYHNKKYDLVIEQTFFCALNPNLRKQYVTKMNELIKPNGKLVGLLFNVPLNETHPPFGGDIKQYKSLFSESFKLNTIEKSYNSIEPRKDKELFINFTPIK